jgi:hypothetical protein
MQEETLLGRIEKKNTSRWGGLEFEIEIGNIYDSKRRQLATTKEEMLLF